MHPCTVGQPNFSGIFASNSIIEFDPNRDSIPIFGSLGHRFTTPRELGSSAGLSPYKGWLARLTKLILLAIYSSNHHMWGIKSKLVTPTFIFMQNITPWVIRAGQFLWKRTKNSLKVWMRPPIKLILLPKYWLHHPADGVK